MLQQSAESGINIDIVDLDEQTPNETKVNGPIDSNHAGIIQEGSEINEQEINLKGDIKKYGIKEFIDSLEDLEFEPEKMM